MANFPKPPEEYTPQWADDFVRALEEFAEEQEQPAGTGFTTFTNLTANIKTLDADATTVAELADVLGNLIETLKSNNTIGK